MDLAGKEIPDFSDVWLELTAYLQDTYALELPYENVDGVKNVLKDKSLSITAKKSELMRLLGVGKKDEPAASIIGLLSGATVKASSVFQNDELDDSEAAKITFKSGYDEKAPTYESVFGESFYLIELLKSVYDWALLADILDDKKYLSYAKTHIFDKHKSDLSLLKEYVKKYAPEKKKEIFEENKSGLCNYAAYSGHLSKGSVEKKCTQDDFLDYLKKQLPPEPAEEKYSEMYKEIALHTFLPKIVTKDNSVIPMQVNKAELVKILDNASDRFPFLKSVDESGKTVKQEIVDVFQFRIPYYVGPLNTHSDKAWLVRNSGKIYPWNFNDIVDTDKSAEKFIENLTNKCTYLVTKDVLPKNSLLYSKFTVLNELNNLKIDGEPISVELKQDIYNDLFSKVGKVTGKRLKGYLKSKGFDDVTISGIDGDFKSTLKSAADLSRYNITDEDKEDIIKYITIFGDDKKMLKRRLSSQLKGKLTDEEIAGISKLKYTGWGRLYISPMSEPIGLVKEKINTVCIENPHKFRDIVLDFIEEEENGDFVFSYKFEPFDIKGNICFVKDYYDLQITPSMMKKIYNHMEKLCAEDRPSVVTDLKQHIISFLFEVLQLCDFEFDFKDDVSLSDVFKMQSVRPKSDNDDMVSSLLNFITVVNRFSRPKCFVLLNPHMYFTDSEIEVLFNSLKYQDSYFVFLENTFSFEKLQSEKITIIDKDLCEILENDLKP